MASGEQIALQPALTGVFAQDLHHPTVAAEQRVPLLVEFLRLPCLARDLEHPRQTVGFGLVGPEDPEVARVEVHRHGVAQESTEDTRGLMGGLGRLRDRHTMVHPVGHLELTHDGPAVGVRLR